MALRGAIPVSYTHLDVYKRQGVDRGKLQVNVTGSRRHRPIPNARIQLSYTADPETELEELDTNESGQTEPVSYTHLLLFSGGNGPVFFRSAAGRSSDEAVCIYYLFSSSKAGIQGRGPQ